jgi:hypothetical protein
MRPFLRKSPEAKTLKSGFEIGSHNCSTQLVDRGGQKKLLNSNVYFGKFALIRTGDFRPCRTTDALSVRHALEKTPPQAAATPQIDLTPSTASRSGQKTLFGLRGKYVPLAMDLCAMKELGKQSADREIRRRRGLPYRSAVAQLTKRSVELYR